MLLFVLLLSVVCVAAADPDVAATAGGYAYVWLARDILTGEVFALKRLPFADEEGFETAKRELELLVSQRA